MFNGGHLPSKHHVPGHDGDALHVNGTQVGVLKQSNELPKPPGGQVQPCFGNDSLT
jgi:hypothetical protein